MLAVYYKDRYHFYFFQHTDAVCFCHLNLYALNGVFLYTSHYKMLIWLMPSSVNWPQFTVEFFIFSSYHTTDLWYCERIKSYLTSTQAYIKPYVNLLFLVFTSVLAFNISQAFSESQIKIFPSRRRFYLKSMLTWLTTRKSTQTKRNVGFVCWFRLPKSWVFRFMLSRIEEMVKRHDGRHFQNQ